MSKLVEVIDFIHNDFDHPDVTTEDVFVALATFDDLYHNGDQSPVTDGEYDALRAYASQVNPAHVYFTGVGSDVRGGKVKLPFEMGSLDQVEIGDIVEWVRKNKLEDEAMIATDKMDGTSSMLIYDKKGKPQIAYSRGNGVEGADISRHIFKIKNVPKTVSTDMTVRAEVELTETSFQALYDAGIRSRSGEPYKNARNMVAGLMNSKTNPAIVYEHLTVIAYEIVGVNDISKIDMLELLGDEGFTITPYATFLGSELNDDDLAEYLNTRRELTDYAIDGIVLDVNNVETRQRMNPTRDTLNPAYSIKYKVADADNHAIATVVDVEWNVSKHGYLKPRIKIEPVELVGVTVQHATGFNAKFIVDNQIGPGATITITRSGDVIPFVTGVVSPCPTGSSWPNEEADWNETGVDLVLADFHINDEVVIQQTIDFFSSVDVPHLKEGNIRKMFEDYDYPSAHSAIGNMLTHPEEQWVRVIGENGSKIYSGIRTKFEEIPLHVLMGSLPFFGRGVGKRKFKKLEVAFGTEGLHNLSADDKDDVLRVEGFQEKTVEKILAGMDEYYDFYAKLPAYVSVAIMEDTSGGSLDGKKICMTGFRDKELAAKIEELGGTNQSGVSSKTDILVIKDPNSTSGKAKKARDLGVTLMGIDEFKNYIGA